jgi:type II secretory pathway component PulF
MPTRLLAGLLRRLSLALAAGIDMRRAWSGEAGRAPPRWRKALAAVGAGLDAGEGLAEALGRAGDTFPPLVRGMAAVGDRTGHEAEALRDVANVLDHAERTRRALLQSLIRPVLQLLLAVAVVGWFIFMGGDLLGIGLKGPRGLVTYLTGLAIVVMVGAAAGWWLVASWRRRGLVRLVIARLPLVGQACRAAEAAAWCRAAALAGAAGLDAGRLLTLAAAVAPGLAIPIDRLEERLRRGASLAEALEASGRFPQRIVRAVGVGELTGNVPEVLDRHAGEFDDEARRSLEAVAQTVAWGIWALTAVIIAVIVIRFVSMYARLIQGAGR